MRAPIVLLLAAACATESPPRARELLGASWPAPSARAERPAPASLTMEQAVELARKAHPLPGALAARVAAADAEVAAEVIPKGPQLRLENFRVGGHDDGPSLRVALRVEPPNPFERPALATAARARANVTRAEADAEWRAIEARVRRAFWNALLAQAEARQAADLLAARTAVATNIRGRLAQRAATRVDLAYAELDEREATVDRQAAEAAAQAARGELLLILGLPESAPVALEGDPLEPARWPEVPSDDALRGLALAKRADLAVAAAQVDEANANLRAADARRYPWIDFVEVGYEFRPELGIEAAFVLSAALRLPFFEWLGADVKHARAARQAAGAELGAAVRIAADDVFARAKAARAARRALAESTDTAALERARRTVAEAVAAGQLDAAGAAEVDVRAARAAQGRIRRARAFYESLEDLREATGGTLPEAP